MTDEKNQTLIEFCEYLMSKGLSESSIKIYAQYYHLFDKGLENNNLTQAYVNRFLIRHSSNATRAFLNNLFEFLGIRSLKTPKLTGRRHKKLRRYLTPDEIKVLRYWIYQHKDIKYLLCLDITYTCALRRAEVLDIKIKDFKIKEWSEDTNKACKLLIRGKGNRERFVPIKTKLMLRILNYISNKGLSFKDNLFDFKRSQWDGVFREAVKSTMDYQYSLHDLRRSRASYWDKHQVPLIKIRDRLGHEDISTTQLYVTSDKEKSLEEWANE